MPEGRGGLENYFVFYNHERPHWALTYRTRAETCGEAPGMLLAGARPGC